MTAEGLPDGNAPDKMADVTNELSPRTADKLRRRGYTATPPRVVDSELLIDAFMRGEVLW